MIAFQILLISICVGLIRSNSSTMGDGTGRISYGELFDPKKFPYVVALEVILNNDPVTMQVAYCTGTLISALYVMTAAHCVNSDEKVSSLVAPSMIKVYLHTLEGQKQDVEKIIEHKDYKSHVKADLCLLKMKSPFNETVEFAKLFGDYKDLGEKGLACTAIGFGNDEVGERHPKGSTAEIILQSGKKGCGYGSATQMNDAYWEEFVCQQPSKHHTCPGDSGGPVICNGVQYAVTSHSFDYTQFIKSVCGSNNTLTIYQYIKPYKSWVDNIISGNGAPNSTRLHRNMFAMITILLLWTNIKNVIF